MVEQARSRQEERHTELLEQNERLIERIESLAEEIRRAVQ
jgi:molybdenum-dependent DNA-binding transcriptional regulator ModE